MRRSAALALALLSCYLALPVRADVCKDPDGNAIPCTVEPLPATAGYELAARISGGALVDYGSDTGTGATYTARIEVDAPLSDWAMGPRLRALVDLTRLPGASQPTDLTVPDASAFDSFQAVEFSGRFVLPVSKHLRFAPFVEAGFASRLNHDPNVPASKSPRWGCGGLTFASTSAGELSAGLCRDQRLGSDEVYQWAAEVDGRIDLWKSKNASGAETGAVVSFVGKAILGLNATTLFVDHPELTGGRGDILRAGLMVSYGKAGQ